MVQRRGVVPALGEDVEHVADRRPADLQGGVVPRWGGTVLRVEWRRLRVAEVLGVVAPPVTQVDPADEGDVLVGAALSPYDEQLLVVRPAATHPLVEERLTTRLVDDGAEVAVLLRR